MLIVGSLDRLDAALEASHMQGRFKLEIVPHTGHQVHEDRPEEVARALCGFLLGVQRQRAAFARLHQGGAAAPTNGHQVAVGMLDPKAAAEDATKRTCRREVDGGPG